MPGFTLKTSGTAGSPFSPFVTASFSIAAARLGLGFIAWDGFADPALSLTVTQTGATWTPQSINGGGTIQLGASGDTTAGLQIFVFDNTGGSTVTNTASIATNGATNINQMFWGFIEVDTYSASPVVQVAGVNGRAGGSAYTQTVSMAALANAANAVISAHYAGGTIQPAVHSGDGYTALLGSNPLLIQYKSPGTTTPRCDSPGVTFEYVESIGVEIGAIVVAGPLGASWQQQGGMGVRLAI